jgi:hypothetical protein
MFDNRKCITRFNLNVDTTYVTTSAAVHLSTIIEPQQQRIYVLSKHLPKTRGKMSFLPTKQLSHL